MNPHADLARRVLFSLCERPRQVAPDDHAALLAAALSDDERRLSLRSLAAIILDRALRSEDVAR